MVYFCNYILDLVDSTKEINAFNNSSVSDAITRMINPGDRVHIPCSVVAPGGSVQWVQNGKPILLVSLMRCESH
jgi:hypothetical protein